MCSRHTRRIRKSRSSVDSRLERSTEFQACETGTEFMSKGRNHPERGDELGVMHTAVSNVMPA